ncbi:hypothetical protein NDU88_005087 [Pleurodeles waltl]|uniref:Uncharacterized protein n=1 Tax=Pleurodeles waltl TaxID=8319 RepID=A0AAV7UHW9_PLEWA|nr:hypothetical protein NDU88_005087 [Pleurodeles waltl]
MLEASIAAVTDHSPEPMELCSGGTAGRTAEQEVTSDPDIRVTRTEIFGREKREWRGPTSRKETCGRRRSGE